MQDKGASGISSLRLIPLLFPVFVTNPSGYTFPNHWYDRNPLNITRSYDSSGVPAIEASENWSYTVPSKRKFYLEHVIARIQRETVAAPVGIAYVYLELIVGVTAYPLVRARIRTNNVGDFDSVHIGHGMLLLEGNTLKGWRGDTSTGGTTQWTIAIKGMEFDA